MINYLEDWQIEDFKSNVGNWCYIGGPTGAGELLGVGKQYSIFRSVVQKYCSNPKGEVGSVFKKANRLAYNSFG